MVGVLSESLDGSAIRLGMQVSRRDRGGDHDGEEPTEQVSDAFHRRRSRRSFHCRVSIFKPLTTNGVELNMTTRRLSTDFLWDERQWMGASSHCFGSLSLEALAVAPPWRRFPAWHSFDAGFGHFSMRCRLRWPVSQP